MSPFEEYPDPTNSKRIPAIAVVIPAFRAEKQIQGVIQSIPEFVSHIIVVDDCSPDQTGELVAQLSNQISRLHLLRHPTNQGVGGAVMSGYLEAVRLGADVIVKIDSDGQMDPEYILPLIEPILSNKADYSKGNRFLHASELKSMPFVRKVGNLGLSFLTKIASGYWNVFDPTNGFTAINAKLVYFLDMSQIDRRFFFESNMLIQLGLLRAVVRDVFIPANYGEETSSLSAAKALFQFPPRLIRGFLHRMVIQYFIRDFTPFSLLLMVGLMLVLFGGLWGSYHWWLSIKTGIVATTGTVMLAVLPLILGIQCLLQSMVLDIQNVPTQPITSV